MTDGLQYGVCIGSDAVYERCAAVGLDLLGVRDQVTAVRGTTSIFPAYNDMIAAAQDAAGLVLLHDDMEIRDPTFERKVLAELEQTDVAVLGIVGSVGLVSLKWWKAQRVGHMPDVHGDKLLGGGSHDVDAVDGALMVLSPWALRNLRFDEETFSGFHGYDVDICLSARAAGKRVRVFEVETFHHTKGGLGDAAAFARADTALRRKWGFAVDTWHVRVRREHPAVGTLVERIRYGWRHR